MIRKLFLVWVGVCLMTLAGIGVAVSINRKSELQKVTVDLDNLAKSTIEILGETPTPETIAEAQKYLDDQKVEVISQIQDLKNQEKIKEGTEAYLILETAYENNKNRFAIILDKLTEKSDQDINALNELIEKLNDLPVSSTQYKKLEKELSKHTNTMRKTASLIKAMGNLVNSFNSIIED